MLNSSLESCREYHVFDWYGIIQGRLLEKVAFKAGQVFLLQKLKDTLDK